jgi:predicted N-acetyltransferase YhbS/predicted acetyltransferase
VIQTERLLLRDMTAADLGSLSAIMQDAETMRAYEGPFSDTETEGWLERQIENHTHWGHGLWAVALADAPEQMVGQCGLTLQHVEGDQVLEVGYLFNRRHWGHGYATEAARACVGLAFREFDAAEVWAIVRDTNLKSMNVAIRCGMEVRRRFTKHYRGVDMPHLAFSVRRFEGTPAWQDTYEHARLIGLSVDSPGNPTNEKRSSILNTNWLTRAEDRGDVAAIREVTLAAFPTAQEADMIDLLRAKPEAWVDGLSQVATDEHGQVVAHCLLTRCVIGQVDALMLGPVAVIPALQKQGAGTAVVNACLAEAKRQGEEFVVLVGHATYYPRFGFTQADRHGITVAIDCPPEVVMALALTDEPLPAGVIHAPVFGL